MKINNQILAQRIATKHANNYCDTKTLRNKSSFNECYQSALEMANEKDKEIAELNRKYNELKNKKKEEDVKVNTNIQNDMEIILTTATVKQPDDIYNLLQSSIAMNYYDFEGLEIWKELTEEEQKKAYKWITSIFQKDENKKPNIYEILNYIAYQLECDRDKWV